MNEVFQRNLVFLAIVFLKSITYPSISLPDYLPRSVYAVYQRELNQLGQLDLQIRARKRYQCDGCMIFVCGTEVVLIEIRIY